MADNFLWKFREMKSIMFHGFAIFSHFLLDVLASDTETTLGDAEDRFLRRHRARLPDDLPLVDRQLSIGTSSAQATGGASSVASSSAANLLGKYFNRFSLFVVLQHLIIGIHHFYYVNVTFYSVLID